MVHHVKLELFATVVAVLGNDKIWCVYVAAAKSWWVLPGRRYLVFVSFLLVNYVLVVLYVFLKFGSCYKLVRCSSFLS